MKRKLLYMFAVVLGAAVLTGCDDIKNSTAFNVDLGSTSFSVPLNLIQGTRAEGTGSFSGSYELKLEDPMFDDLREYLDGSNRIEFTSTSVEITAFPAAGIDKITLNDVKISGTGISPDYSKAEIVSGTGVSDDALQAFINGLLGELQEGEDITVTVSGETDATRSDFGSVKIEIGLKAKVYPLK